MNNACLLLCRSKISRINILQKDLSKYIDTFFICDDEINTQAVLSKNFIHLNRIYPVLENTKITAWEKSFFYIEQKGLQYKYDNFYFIEDDVYSKNNRTFIALIAYWNSIPQDLISSTIKSRQQNPNWDWWKRDIKYQSYFKNPYRSFNPICRLSSKLISLILNFRKNYNKFYFHEILFSSIAIENCLNYFDYNIDSESQKYIGKVHFRPRIIPGMITDDKIYHPVKPYFY